MSNTLRVGIEVSVDGSAAEAGLAGVEAAARRTGRTLDTLGNTGGAAMGSVGAQGASAAGRVDVATRNMTTSIQRTIATMSAGAKGSAEYYAALANSRGLNLAALRPYLDQLDAVTKKTAAAAEAQRQLEASNRFLDGLRSQAEGIGKTASQLATLRAEQLGVADAARPFIEQLRAAEEAAGGARDSFGDLAQAISAVALGGSVAAVVSLSDEYGKLVAQLKLATEGQTEFQNAQNAVRRIATTSQADLSATASLYANITKGTRELGIAQTQVANITETVSLALKVSGATGGEAASAILQLSQAFASGTLRGDEFNSVNEAAPRLMQALADGMGVPIGALRKMAEEGQLTTAVLADSLPRALGTLREEAKSVESIAGAYTVLKNNILEMVGATAQSNGVVAALSGSINLLAENLTLAAGAMATVAAVKLGTSLAAATREAYAAAAANQARLSSNLAAARADVAATASASALAAARVAELRASVLATDGAVALAIATNGLIPAQARATAASAAHTAALAAQTAAMGAASFAGRAASSALALLGGPVGAVIALLGVAATAWAVWGESAQKSQKQVSETTEASTEEVLANLDKQIAKLKERNRLAALGFKPAEIQAPGAEKLAEVLAKIDRVAKAEGEYANLSLAARTEILRVLGGQYGVLTEKIAEFNRESEADTNNRNKKSAGEWMQKYATNTEKLSAELKKARDELGSAFTPELEARIRKQFEERKKGADKEASAYTNLVVAVDERIAQTAREAAGLKPVTDSQKLQISLDEGLASGKLKLTTAQKSEYEARIRSLAVNERVIESQKRAAQGQAEIEKLYKSLAEERKREIDTARQEAERNEQAAATYGMTKAQIEALTLARLEDQLAQRSSLSLTLDEIEHLEALIEAKKRSAAALSDLEGLQKQKDLWADIEKTAHDTFVSIADGGKDAAQRLKDTFKNVFFDWLYQMTLKKWIINLSGTASLSATGGAAASSAGGSSGGGIGSSLGSVVTNSLGSYFGAGGLSGALTAGAGWMTGATTFSGALSAGASLVGTGTLGGIASGMGMMVGALGPIALGVAAIVALAKKWDDSGTIHTGGAATASAAGVSNINATDLNFQRINTAEATNTLTAQLATSIVGMLDSTATSFGQSAGYTAATAFADDTSKDGAWGALVISKLGDKLIDWQDTRTSRWAPKEFNDGEAGQAEYLAALGVSVRSALDSIGLPAWAETMLDDLGNAPSLEQLATVVDAINATQAALVTMGERLVGFADLSDAAASALMAASGGIDALAANASSYYDAFYSDSERAAAVSAQIAEVLQQVGLQMPATREAFREQVEAQMRLGTSGASAAAALLSVASAFAEVVPAAADVLQQRSELQQQLDELTMTSTEALASQRDAIDASNLALYDQVQAAQAVKDAQDAAKQSLSSFITQMGNFATTAASLNDSLVLGSLSTLTPEQQYAEARRQFEQTRQLAYSGDTAAQGNLDAIEQAFLQISQTINGGDSQYASDLATVMQTNENLAAWAVDSVDVAQASLDQLTDQSTSLANIQDILASIAQGSSIVPAASTSAMATQTYATVDYTAYGSAQSAALVAEIKALRASNEEMTAELKGLRADAARQTGDQITAITTAAEQAADKIVDGTTSALTNGAWQAENATRKPA